ncbi:MAG: site-2 protease family protein [Phycisphaerae bacterium]|nr:site-2 protease family protein [Phycisphaerae bacterium]MDD5381494.1 site-2 protease family protein [Phycisphaerae bacterium]
MTDDYSGNEGSTTDNEGQDGQTQERAYEEVFAEIEKQRTQQKSWLTNIFILGFSLLIFFQLGLFSWGLESLITLIGVILIHEMGHLFGMRLFGYKNVQMFFIPFFGAAVSGEKRDVAAYKEAIVSLLGPAPGVIIGCVLLVIFAATGRKDYLNLANMFLFINVFNLLPFYPLDGGRFLYTVLFSRNRYLELCFRIFAALALILVGYALGAWLLAGLGLLNLWVVRIPFKLAKAAKDVKQTESCRTLFACSIAEVDSDTIPPSVGRVIIDKVYELFPPPVGINIVAGHTKQIWERICFRPGGVFSTAGLLVVYFFLFLFPLAALIGSVVVGRSSLVETKMVEYQKPDGSKGLKEQKYFGGKLSSETEVDPESYLYHGKYISYSYADANTVSQEGTWSDGKWDGEWKTYNSQVGLVRVTILDKGNFVSQKEKVDGQWVEKKWEDLPSLYRRVIKKQQEKVSGPKKKRE